MERSGLDSLSDNRDRLNSGANMAMKLRVP